MTTSTRITSPVMNSLNISDIRFSGYRIVILYHLFLDLSHLSSNISCTWDICKLSFSTTYPTRRKIDFFENS